MVVQADQRDFKKSFTKHYHTYLHWPEQASDNSRQLILVYCVESGLKCFLMKTLHLSRVSDAQDKIIKILTSHDLESLLKENHIGGHHFPLIKTIHGDVVPIKRFHELCRYCVPVAKDHLRLPELCENHLKAIASLLSERI